MKYSIGLLSLMLLLVDQTTFAQPDTTYIDKDWKQTDKDSASYFRTWKKLGDNAYEARDYYLDGQIQMIGHYSSYVPINVDTERNPAREGLFTYYDNRSRTKTKEGKMANGLAEGQWKDFYVNTGSIAALYDLKNDMHEGKDIVYDSVTGRITIEGQYKQDHQVGVWHVYYGKSGKILRETNFSDSISYSKGFYENGNLSEEGSYNDKTKRTGKWKTYDTSGFLTGIYSFVNDTLCGPYVEYKVLPRSKLSKENSSYIENGNKNFVSSLKEVGQTKDGKQNDTIKFYNPVTGELKELQQYKDQVKDGIYITYENKLIKDLGYYKDGLKNGVCKTYFSNTEQLYVEATYLKGKREGVGTEYFMDGTKRYEATFHNDHRNGILISYYSTGTLKSRETYFMDTLEGLAVYYDLSSGKVSSEGTYINSKKNGEWRFYNNKGQLEFVKNFREGVLSGAWIRYSSQTGKKEVEGYFVSDRKDGSFKYYFDNSDSISCTEIFKDGALNGSTKHYSIPGCLKYEGQYVNGDKIGNWNYFYQNKTRRAIINYVNDKKNGVAQYYDSTTGKMTSRGLYADDRMTDEWTYYYPNSANISLVKHYLNNSLNGETINYDTSGKMLFKGNFVDNKKEGNWQFYYGGNDAGKIWISVNFAIDTLNGAVDIYYPSGKKMVTQLYHKGIKDNEKYYEENGLPMEASDLKIQLAIKKRINEVKDLISIPEQ